MSNPDVTGLVVVSCFDTRSSFVVRTVLPNHTYEYVASTMAFVGARISRSSDTFEDIFAEVYRLAGKAQKRLANIFRAYGHASVAEMADMFVFLENISDYHAAKLFYESSFGAGQQRSTRYQEFGNLPKLPLTHYFREAPASLQRQFAVHLRRSDELYTKWRDCLGPAFAEYFGIDENNKQQVSALTARTFDTARAFLLGGITNRTSVAYLTQAREWAKIIAIFKSEADPELNRLGEQIEFLLAPTEALAEQVGYTPEAPDLIRYTQSDETTLRARSNLGEWYRVHRSELHETDYFRPLEQDVELLDLAYGSEKLFAQALLSVNPKLQLSATLTYLHRLPVDEKRKLSHLLLDEYDCYRQMPEWLGTNSHTFALECTYAEYRDFNRHRVWNKFVPLFSSGDKCAALGYGVILPLYLEVSGLDRFREEFTDDCLHLQEGARLLAWQLRDADAALDYLAPQLSTFAANCRPVMSGSPKHISYMTDRRQKPGGHINYRDLSYRMAQAAAAKDPWLDAVQITDPAPDPASQEQFLDRS